MLGQHYAEGRLDATEFNERIELATTAKTRADLSTLLTDLPGPDTGTPAPTGQRHRPRLRSVLVLAFLAVAAVWALSEPHVAWLLAAVVVLVVWRRLTGHGRHHNARTAAPQVGSGS
jgi:Flp pilus assembly protein TadB